jgi:hypothetical protein
MTTPLGTPNFVPTLMEHSAADDLALDGFWESAAAAYLEASRKATDVPTQSMLRVRHELASRAAAHQKDCGLPTPMYVRVMESTDGWRLFRLADMKPMGKDKRLDQALRVRDQINADLVEHVNTLCNHQQYMLAKVLVGIMPATNLKWEPAGHGSIEARFAHQCMAIITERPDGESVLLRFESATLMGPVTGVLFADVLTAQVQAVLFFAKWLKHAQPLRPSARNWSATDVTRN